MSANLKVTVCRIDPDAPLDYLWHHYERQREAQPVFIQIDLRDGEVSIDWDGTIGSGTTAAVAHGHVRRYPLPGIIPTPAAANALLARIAPLAQSIMDAHHAGDDAAWHEAERALADYMDYTDAGLEDSDLVTEWPVEIIDATYWDEVRHDMSDEDVAGLEREILDDLKLQGGYGCVVSRDLLESLMAQRDAAPVDAATVAAAVADLLGTIPGPRRDGAYSVDTAAAADAVGVWRLWVADDADASAPHGISWWIDSPDGNGVHSGGWEILPADQLDSEARFLAGYLRDSEVSK